MAELRDTLPQSEHTFIIFLMFPRKAFSLSWWGNDAHLIILKQKAFHFKPSSGSQDSPQPQHPAQKGKTKAPQLSQITPWCQRQCCMFPKSLFLFLLTHGQTKFLVHYSWVGPHELSSNQRNVGGNDALSLSGPAPKISCEILHALPPSTSSIHQPDREVPVENSKASDDEDTRNKAPCSSTHNRLRCE